MSILADRIHPTAATSLHLTKTSPARALPLSSWLPLFSLSPSSTAVLLWLGRPVSAAFTDLVQLPLCSLEQPEEAALTAEWKECFSIVKTKLFSLTSWDHSSSGQRQMIKTGLVTMKGLPSYLLTCHSRAQWLFSALPWKCYSLRLPSETMHFYAILKTWEHCPRKCRSVRFLHIYTHTDLHTNISTHTHIYIYIVRINFILEISQMQLPCISKRQELQETQERHKILATSN